jgi:hypothetical protein
MTSKKNRSAETMLLNKDAYLSFASGDGACLVVRKNRRPPVRGAPWNL